jgi:hypothetical protein
LEVSCNNSAKVCSVVKTCIFEMSAFLFVYILAVARLQRSWVRIPLRAWMFVCCVLSGRGLFNELITGPEES